MQTLVKAGAVVLALAFVPQAASARDGFRGGVIFSFGAPAPYYPYYYAPPAAYGPPPVAYAPPPGVVYPASPPPQTNLGAEVSQNCREYTAPANVGGRTVQTYGTACLQPDGTWRIVE